ncbi:MAG TPA: OsmC family peroxiredoxin, partial [Ramlibacter sp.]|nr:OsmC family peroxiredoxin [Ramlibacter sp.]
AAQGRMGRFADGRQGITHVLLRPQVVVSGARRADDAAIDHLHHEAHERCDLAHSIRGEVQVEGAWRHAG